MTRIIAFIESMQLELRQGHCHSHLGGTHRVNQDGCNMGSTAAEPSWRLGDEYREEK